jgi:hypothetical protein
VNGYEAQYNDPKDYKEDSIMIDLHLPQTVAGYAYPICAHCDKEYGPEVANVGPVQCDECGEWFEVYAKTIYQSQEKLDYADGGAAAPKKSLTRPENCKPR